MPEMTKEEHDKLGVARDPEEAVIATAEFLNKVKELAKNAGFHAIYVMPVVLLKRDKSTPAPEDDADSSRLGQTAFVEGCVPHMLQALATSIVNEFTENQLGFFCGELSEKMMAKAEGMGAFTTPSQREKAAADFFKLLSEKTGGGKPN